MDFGLGGTELLSCHMNYNMQQTLRKCCKDKWVKVSYWCGDGWEVTHIVLSIVVDYVSVLQERRDKEHNNQSPISQLHGH